jgi:hypothetical protein
VCRRKGSLSLLAARKTLIATGVLVTGACGLEGCTGEENDDDDDVDWEPDEEEQDIRRRQRLIPFPSSPALPNTMVNPAGVSCTTHVA